MFAPIPQNFFTQPPTPPPQSQQPTPSTFLPPQQQPAPSPQFQQPGPPTFLPQFQQQQQPAFQQPVPSTFAPQPFQQTTYVPQPQFGFQQPQQQQQAQFFGGGFQQPFVSPRTRVSRAFGTSIVSPPAQQPQQFQQFQQFPFTAPPATPVQQFIPFVAPPATPVTRQLLPEFTSASETKVPTPQPEVKENVLGDEFAALMPEEAIAEKGPTQIIPVPEGSKVLGPTQCYNCGRSLDYTRYLNLITLTRDKGMDLAAAVDEMKYTDLRDKITERISNVFKVSKPRAICYLLDNVICCLLFIQNPAIGTVTRIHTGVNQAGEPLTSLYSEINTDILASMFGLDHPLLKVRLKKPPEEKERKETKEAKQ